MPSPSTARTAAGSKKHTAAMDIAVIGAGMAGITCARTLAQAGHEVTVFEKSRGMGGRMAARRSEGGAVVDHGLPVLDVPRDGVLAGYVVELATDDLVEVDAPGQPVPGRSTEGAPQLAWASGMTRLPKALAHGLEVVTDTRVAAIRADGEMLEVAQDQGNTLGTYDWVIVTAPGAQAADLLDHSPRGAVRAADLRAAEVRLSAAGGGIGRVLETIETVEALVETFDVGESTGEEPILMPVSRTVTDAFRVRTAKLSAAANGGAVGGDALPLGILIDVQKSGTVTLDELTLTRADKSLKDASVSLSARGDLLIAGQVSTGGAPLALSARGQVTQATSGAIDTKAISRSPRCVVRSSSKRARARCRMAWSAR